MLKKIQIHFIYFILNSLILLSFVFNKPLLVIPFQKKSYVTSDLSKESVIKILEQNIILIDFNLGTPSQKLRLNVRSDSPYSYVFYENTSFDEIEPKDYKPFQTQNSTSYNNLGPVHISHPIIFNCDLIEDTLKFFGYPSFPIKLAQPPEVLFIESYFPSDSGVLGLGNIIFDDESEASTNFIWNLKKNDLIGSYDYFYEYINDTHGNIVIGGEPFEYNETLYKNKTNVIARNPTYTLVVLWGFNSDKIYYKGKDLKKPRADVYITFNYGFILVPKYFEEILKEEFLNELISQKKCELVKSMINPYHSYVCQKGSLNSNKLGVLELFNVESQMRISINLKELIYDVGSYSYLLIQFREDTESQFELGEPFLKQNMIVFNQDMKVIKMYNPNLKEEDERHNKPSLVAVLIAVFILCLIIIGILGFIFYYRNKIFKFFDKRQKGIELAEETDYSSMSNK